MNGGSMERPIRNFRFDPNGDGPGRGLSAGTIATGVPRKGHADGTCKML